MSLSNLNTYNEIGFRVRVRVRVRIRVRVRVRVRVNEYQIYF